MVLNFFSFNIHKVLKKYDNFISNCMGALYVNIKS